MKTGVVVKKIGMTSLFTEDGARFPVTFLQMIDCQVVGHKTVDKDGYVALLIGAKNTKASKLSKPLREMFAKVKIEPKAILKEFRVGEEDLLDIGSLITVDHFAIGQFVDVTGVTIGKGFAGGMKRHNFRGLEASHGVSVSHRSHGSTGGRQDPGKVFKNKKMAGHMGSARCTIQNLKVVGIDENSQIIMVKGSVPGAKGSTAYLRDSIKKSASL